jgi:hypothetical protein
VTERRWPLIAAVVVALALAAAAWAAGRASAPDTPADGGDTPNGGTAAVRTIGGVPVGVQRSRTGALAAADNYVAIASETVLQDPNRFEALVREAFTAREATEALADAKRDRDRAPEAIENYAAGGRAVAVVGARRLDAYDGSTAAVTTWAGGFVWGPQQKPSQRWFLSETTLAWAGDRWRVSDMEEATRPAPAPNIVSYKSEDALKAATFDRELRAMSAPTYGTK